MEISLRALLTAIHGMLFGGFFVLATFGLVVELVRADFETQPGELCSTGRFLANLYLAIAAAMGWAAVLLGTYVAYPWYRAIPPAGTLSLAAYPQRLLLSSPTTAGWHSFGMEWKEHVAWIAPMAVTMAAYVLWKQRTAIKSDPQIRTGVLVFALAALASAGVASFFGAMINKNAPVQGGAQIRLLTE
jgi:hypothetical protein